MTKPYTIKDAINRDSALSVVLEKQGNDYYLSINQLRPSTPAILNTSITDDNWTAIATGLTSVLGWRLSERSGADFYFAFVSSPTTYATAFGWVGDNSAITSIYVKRKNSTTNNMELLYWTA